LNPGAWDGLATLPPEIASRRSPQAEFRRFRATSCNILQRRCNIEAAKCNASATECNVLQRRCNIGRRRKTGKIKTPGKAARQWENTSQSRRESQG
jgi:hypothetical protein